MEQWHDVVAIRDVIDRYATGIDRRDRDRDVGPTLHRITNHQVHVDGDAAAATSYFDALLQVEHRDHDLLQVVGTSTDEFARTDDGWKITARRSHNYLWRRGDRGAG